MNREIKGMLSDAEGRYLEPTEQSMLKEFADSLDQRLESMRATQAVESDVVEQAVNAVLDEHPEAAAKLDQLEDKTRRDITLVLRYCAMAMVRNDEQFLEEKLLHWFRTIIEAYEMSEYAETGYTTLREACEEQLEDKHFRRLRPYLERTCEILGGEE